MHRESIVEGLTLNGCPRPERGEDGNLALRTAAVEYGCLLTVKTLGLAQTLRPSRRRVLRAWGSAPAVAGLDRAGNRR